MPPWPEDIIYQKNIGYVDNIPDLECRQKNERYERGYYSIFTFFPICPIFVLYNSRFFS